MFEARQKGRWLCFRTIAVAATLGSMGCGTADPIDDPEPDTEGSTEGFPQPPDTPSVVFDGTGQGIVLKPMYAGMFRTWAIGAPGDEVEGFDDAGRTFFLELSLDPVGPARSAPSVIAEDARSDFCDSNARFALTATNNRKFGSSFAFYSQRSFAASSLLDYEQNLLVGAPEAGMESGRVMGYRVCLSCGLFPRVPGQISELELGTRFGSALAIGFFASDVPDGLEQLAIGAPRFNFNGGVHIYSQTGFRTWELIDTPSDAGNQACDFGTTIGPTAEDEVFRERTLSGGLSGESFGQALTVGDFNCDGIDDLAVGAPTADVPSASGLVRNAGAVYVFYGGRLGLGNEGSLTLIPGQLGLEGAPQPRGAFGHAFAVGDFDGSRTVGEPPEGSRTCFDLAIGAPGQAGGAGEVFVIYGSPEGLQPFRNQILRLGSGGIPGEEPSQARLGASLVADEFQLTSEAKVHDLAVGAPGHRTGGSVTIVPGRLRSGLDTEVSLQLVQGEGMVPGENEDEDQFGAALASAFDFLDVAGDDELTFALLVGAPGEDGAAGAVTLVPLRENAEDSDLPFRVSPGARVFRQEDFGEVSERGDGFGAVISTPRAFTRAPWRSVQ